MASKQIVSNIQNAERAVNTKPTFGEAGVSDPWREGPSLAGLHQALSPDYSKPYGDKTVAFADRFGTAGGQNNTFTPPPPADVSQRPEAQMKGATADGYRVTVSQVVQ